MDLRLGRSLINRKLLSTMRRGDILLIGIDTFELYSSEQRIGKFMINDNGEVRVQNLNGVTESEELEDHISLGEIPMRVDFILQRRTMTLMELDDLYQGQYLQLDPSAEKQVEIMANGIRIARGELVEFNGRLGIELNHVRVSSKGTEKSD